MTETTDLLGAGTSQDPRVGLRAVAALRKLVEQLEALQVHAARTQGWSWAEIAGALGVSKQAVHKKHASGRKEMFERFPQAGGTAVVRAQEEAREHRSPTIGAGHLLSGVLTDADGAPAVMLRR